MSAPNPAVSDDQSDRALIGRVFRQYLVPRWRGLGAAALCAAVVAVLTALLAQILEPAINRLIVRPDARALIEIPAAIVVMALIRGIAQIAQVTLVNQVGHGLVGDIQAQLFGKLL